MAKTPNSNLNRAKQAEEQEFCYDLKLSGYSYRDISDRSEAILGYRISASTAYRRVEAEIAEKVQPRAEQLRTQELDRMDLYLKKLEPRIFIGDDKAINAALRISERRAKLLGIDAPEKVESTVEHSVKPDLVERIKRAKELQLTRENQIIAID